MRPTAVNLIGGFAFVVCVSLGVAVYVHQPTHGTRTPPPPTDSRWRWVGAGPGMNIYYADRTKSTDGVVSVWIDHRLFSNLAGINKDLFDAWEVDCRQRRVRPAVAASPGQTPPATTGAIWSAPRTGDPHQRLLHLVCADTDPQALP